jgi:hypothetical protein
MNSRVVQGVVVGGLAFAAVAAPLLIGGSSSDVQAQCRAYLGSRNDGICIDGPDTQAPSLFSPINVGPTGEGPGISSGNLLPGQTIEMPIA